MSQLLKDGDRLVLTLGNVQADARPRRFDFQLLSPLLLGLMVPFVAAAYFDPEALEHVKYPIWLFLIVMMLLCTGLFIYTVHVPGQLSRLEVDRNSRAVEIVWQSLLSTTTHTVPFEEISALKVRNDYDDDGYPTPVAEIVLRSRDAIRLPADTSDEHLSPLRAAIGLA
jgi:hypothetical protein